jgi:hypothetical protein
MTESCCRSNRSDGGEATVTMMKLNKFSEVDVADTISPCQHERLPADEWLQSLDPTACLSSQTCLDQLHLPGLDFGCLLEIDCSITNGY